MSGLEVAGLVLGTIPLLISGLESYNQAFRSYKRSAQAFKTLCEEHGILYSVILRVFFSNALYVMNKVERYVVPAQDHEVIAFMKSYTSSFNMIGVAGAIIAQVAITALSLTGLDDSHWTAEAFFVISIVTGALSVFFSCANSPSLHGLHSADDIRDFLTKPSRSADRQQLNDLLKKTERLVIPNEDHLDALRKYRWRTASAYSAVMLVVPMYLLNVALSTFLTGLGIYLGKLYTGNLIPSFGSGALGILVIYIGSTLVGLSIFYVAKTSKYLEDLPRERYQSLLDKVGSGPGNLNIRERRTEGANRPASQTAPKSIQQSVHARDNGKVHFVIGSDQTVCPSPNQENDTETVQPSENILDSLMRPLFSPPPGSSSQSPDEPDLPQRSDIEPAADIGMTSVQAALMDLIKAQEEGLRASKRLQEAFEASSSSQ
ncbi:hypothetical protein K505DRAFT_370952 [Melanomma pulvis-pyrius CBS 109.77]|uniref:Uncharacterized protein n=1 Tax=Melanomma pulvis-pyrius CBS 109.77 TaxID=1314802 RepID=A0A6A6XVE0_9PLEO|nr:hypothetical protein K505DRAFT_370952 [Melanomma pulvis-pyrius CBS 109.77]